MIQIQNPSQFTKAAERCQKERMLVRVKAFRSYTVTNQTNGRTYEVFFSILNGKKFGACNCAAGYPMNSARAPKVCKHLLNLTPKTGEGDKTLSSLRLNR